VTQPRRTGRVAAIAAVVATTLLVAGTPVPAPAAEPPAEWDGLTRAPSKQVDLLYVRPGASLAGYQRLRLDPVQVAFDKNWTPNRDARSLSQRVSSTDMEKIKTDLATEFSKILKAELGKSGYGFVDVDGEDVLRVTAAIADLSITAPGNSDARSRSYVANAGAMTLVIELRDSVSGQLLARVIDREEARTNGRFEVSSRAANSGAAITVMSRWASLLRKGLDDVKGQPPTR
jgi:hypothetical protein